MSVERLNVVTLAPLPNDRRLRYSLHSKQDSFPAAEGVAVVRLMPHDVVLVDGHKLMRDGIRAILERGAEFRVVGEAESGADAWQLCKQTHPDLVIMDIGLPGMNGIEATAKILRYSPQTRVLIVSVYDDASAVLSAIRSGARGFLLKRASSDDLLDALRSLALGGSYLSSQVSARLIERLQSGELQLQSSLVPVETLSPREQQLLRLIAVRGWPAIRLAVGFAPGTSRRPRLSLWGFLMRTSNRSGYCSRIVSVTISKPPYADPYARWCSRGRRVTTAPMPIKRRLRK
jgi:two-component system response regulator DegU